MVAGPVILPSQLCLNLGIEPEITGLCNSQSVGVTNPYDSPESSETPATSKRRGSFNWNWENG